MQDVIGVIEAKRDGRTLSDEQIAGVVGGFTGGIVPDYQMSAFLMAVVCRGMTLAETVAMTRAMVASGSSLDLSSIPGLKFDKHSTGGVGDKVSLALVPILAAAGVPIAKMSGRGLGHTGGTLDKLESIAGFRVQLTAEEIVSQVRLIGGCLCAQTEDIVPADKKIYALRDVTGTVESIPLIASSIMSKKIAGGGDVILLDVKVGSGAFMKNLDDARRLAATLQHVGQAFGKKTAIELTSMDAPLGHAVGNLVEVWEIAQILRGCPERFAGACIDARLKQVIVDLSNRALTLAGLPPDAHRIVADGSAWRKFVQIVEAQGGAVSTIDRWSDVLPLALVAAPRSGYVTAIDAEGIGRLAVALGAGRTTKDDPVDPLAGVWIDASVGSRVAAGASLMTLYTSAVQLDRQAVEKLTDLFVIEDDAPALPPLIIETMPVETPH